MLLSQDNYHYHIITTTNIAVDIKILATIDLFKKYIQISDFQISNVNWKKNGNEIRH